MEIFINYIDIYLLMGDKEIILSMTKEIGDTFDKFGFPRLIAEIWTLLYFKGDMTQDELKKELSCSLSSISQSLKILENLGSVEISKKEGRKNVYSAQDSVKKTMKKRMGNIDRYLLDPMIQILNENESEIKNKELQSKIINMKKKCSKMKTMISIIAKIPG